MALEFVELDDNLNSVSPVLNFGTDACPANLYSGILNVKLREPAPLVTSGLPSTGESVLENSDELGVQNYDTAFPSKNAYILMPGLKQSLLTVIVLGLIKGINALAITLLP